VPTVSLSAFSPYFLLKQFQDCLPGIFYFIV